MYSVLIVDDDKPVLESYAHIITNDTEHFFVCAAAGSGTDALRLSYEKRPDVLIVDLAMPGLDGIETIREIQTKLPETVCILATAYERFDVAQEAIVMHVFEYIVKPVTKKKLLATLGRSRLELESREKKIENRLNDLKAETEIIEREKRNFLLQMTCKAFTLEEWERYRRLFRIKSDYGVVLMLRVSRISGDLDRAELFPAIVERLEKRYQCFTTEYLGKLLILLPGLETATGVIRFLESVFKKRLSDDAPFIIGAGSCRRYEELHHSCEEALQTFLAVDRDAEPIRQQEKRRKALRKAFGQTSSYEEIRKQSVELWDTEFSLFSFLSAKGRMIAFFTLLLDDTIKRTQNTEVEALIGEPARDIMKIGSRSEWDAWAARVMRVIIRHNSEHRNEKLPAPLLKAVQYIDAHYQEPLQRDQVAEVCSISPGYLSRLFADFYDTSFNSYLNTRRITLAAQMLSEETHTVTEIAGIVGYSDPNYFSRVFKKYFGKPPAVFLAEKRAERS